jgi:hypothetical protein
VIRAVADANVLVSAALAWSPLAPSALVLEAALLTPRALMQRLDFSGRALAHPRTREIGQRFNAEQRAG